jgi:hypothetical protein
MGQLGFPEFVLKPEPAYLLNMHGTNVA